MQRFVANAALPGTGDEVVEFFRSIVPEMRARRVVTRG